MSRPFKDVFYDNYRSSHTLALYGDMTREGMKKFYPTWRQYFGQHLPTHKDAQILDIGCGDAAFVDFLIGLGYANTFGIDLSPEQIDHGKKLGIPNLALADLTEFLPQSIGKYDLIIARDVLEHFTHQAAFEMLIAVNASLKPGGKFVMQVPNGQGIFYTSIFWGDFTHEVAFTEQSVRQLFGNTGFSSSQCYPTGPVPATIRAKVRKVLWSLKVLETRFWKAVETGSPKGIFTSNLIAVGQK